MGDVSLYLDAVNNISGEYSNSNYERGNRAGAIVIKYRTSFTVDSICELRVQSLGCRVNCAKCMLE